MNETMHLILKDERPADVDVQLCAMQCIRENGRPKEEYNLVPRDSIVVDKETLGTKLRGV